MTDKEKIEKFYKDWDMTDEEYLKLKKMLFSLELLDYLENAKLGEEFNF